MDALAQHPQRAASEPVPTAIAQRGIGGLLLALLAHPNIASKERIIRRYDHEIRGATMQRPLVGVHGDGPGDGTVLVEPGEQHGIAVGIGVSPFTGEADAERMAWLVIDEAIRNAVAVGADPSQIALLDNFSWGDPRRAMTLGQLVAAVDGCVAAAAHYAAPFVSGKDSLNNEWVDCDDTRRSVPPTLVITAVGCVPDARIVVGADAKEAGNLLVVLGPTASQWCGSHAARVVEAIGTIVPAPDSAAPQRYAAVHQLMKAGILRACHDPSEGGLAVAVAEMLIGGRLGARMHAPPSGIDAHTWWFAESPARLIVEIHPSNLDAVQAALSDDVHMVATLTSEATLQINDDSIALTSLVNAFGGLSQ